MSGIVIFVVHSVDKFFSLLDKQHGTYVQYVYNSRFLFDET